MSGTYSAATWKKWDRAQAGLDRIHSCDLNAFVARVASPGYQESGYSIPGVSRWTCGTCLPMIEALMDEHFGGHSTTFKATS